MSTGKVGEMIVCYETRGMLHTGSRRVTSSSYNSWGIVKILIFPEGVTVKNRFLELKWIMSQGTLANCLQDESELSDTPKGVKEMLL